MNEFKYAQSGLNIFLGVAFICLGILHVFMFVFMMARGVNIFMILIVILLSLEILLGVFYLNLTKRNYVVIDTWGISIDKGMVMPSKDAYFDDIKMIKVLGEDMRIGLHSGNELRIKLKCLTIDDIEAIDRLVNKELVKTT